MIGDTIIVDGIEMEVVWSGGELIPERETRAGSLWTAPPRIYNKKSDYWTRDKTKPAVEQVVEQAEVVDKPSEKLEDPEEIEDGE